jgi:hypothetical protein
LVVTPSTRRRALAGGAAGALSLLLAACGPPSDQQVDRESKSEPTDGNEILQGGVTIVQQSIAAYDAALAGLHGRDRTLAARLRAQDMQHLAELGKLLGTAAAPAPALGAAPRGRTQALALLARAEERAIGYWIDALPKLVPELRATPAGIVTNDAQHLALVRAALGLRALSSALVEGRST